MTKFSFYKVSLFKIFMIIDQIYKMIVPRGLKQKGKMFGNNHRNIVLGETLEHVPYLYSSFCNGFNRLIVQLCVLFVSRRFSLNSFSISPKMLLDSTIEIFLYLEKLFNLFPYSRFTLILTF